MRIFRTVNCFVQLTSSSTSEANDNLEENMDRTEERNSKAPGSGSLSGLLRRLSIRSRASVTKEKPPSCDKRLSAVIGCYLPPSLLGLSSEDCQVI